MNLDRCTRLIAGFEGFVSFVYDDSTWPSRNVTPSECQRSGGQWQVEATGGTATVGYGETDADFISQHWGGITEPQAFQRLEQRVNEFAVGVFKFVKVPMTFHQHEAMTSLAFNIGLGAFETSTVLRKLNSDNLAGAAQAFLLWVKPVSLIARRKAEIAHFLTKDEDEPVADTEHLHPVWRERVQHACDELGVEVYSGARSTERQAALYQDFLAGRGNPANPPGTSWHEYGDGLKGGSAAVAVDFSTTSALYTLRSRAAEFGMCFPIPNEDWHAQPAEITEPARVDGAEDRLPSTPDPESEEDQLFSSSPIRALHLVAAHSRLMLTSVGDTHGSRVIQAPANGSLNQRWEIVGHPDGRVSFVNRAGGLALDRPDGADAPGTTLQVANTVYNDNQKWQLADYLGQLGLLYRIWVPGTNRLVDVAGNTQNQGDFATLWTALDTNGANQLFIMVPTI